jgi:hypothetical protein
MSPYVTGAVTVDGREIPLVSTRLSAADLLGGARVRCDIGRMRYTVAPGLYAVGSPAPESPVLVTANYKLSFDSLRRELPGLSAWLLVLDTQGINVWCAAGKGTFGTRELERRIIAVRLDRVVNHRTLILPQLGAPGVSAHEVEDASGFHVTYGPVRARDIPAWLAAGMKKDAEMRRVRFRLRDRLVLAPTELVHAWPFLVAVLAASGLFALPPGPGFPARFLSLVIPLSGSVLLAAIGFPALLPLLPFRAFALKGAVLGALWGVAAALVEGATPALGGALVLLSTPIVSFIAMSFTGASTFTCQPGAVLEVRRGIIPMIASTVLGAGLAVAARLTAL